MYNITGLADIFSSDMMLSADGGSLWAAHKMTGQMSVIDLAARKVISVLETGAETNHPQFAYPHGQTHVFVTVAALNETKVYLQPSPDKPPTYLTSIRSTGIEPHGLWANPSNTRLYIANEHSDTMDIVDLETLKVIDTLQIGQETQAVVYVSNAVPEGNGRQNLGTQGLIKEPRPANAIVRVTGPNTPANGSALITVRPASGVDEFQVIGRNIHANSSYTVYARCLQCPHGLQIPLVSFTAAKTPTGCGDAPQVLSFFKWFGVWELNSIKITED
jgi:YVTN family beta-propeller protein